MDNTNITLSPYQQCLQLIKEKPRLKDRFFILQTIENDYAVILDELKANAVNRVSIQPPPYDPHSDESKEQEILFIHNARQWQLLKESIKNGVFIDKFLIIISHEFLLYEKQEISITLEKLCNYLMIDFKKATLNYVRKEIKKTTDFLIEKGFIDTMAIKNSMLICKLSTLFIEEMKERRIITRIAKNAFSLSSDQYRIRRITSFFENNLKIKQNELNIDTLIEYFKDTNKNRKKNEIKNLLDIQ